jgi:ubiquinone/menaquinone biosynthesis C-methylase UbiE
MDWHSRFLQQAGWTSALRLYLFERAGLVRARRVLDVGCGTGAILSGLTTTASINGVDLDPARLVEARLNTPSASLTCGNALALPYQSGIFDITFCHFLLLWVHDPLMALTEMKRVTRSGGAVLALAEPDYTSRVDKPAALAPLGRWQTESLERQGADTGLGRHLADLFRQAGLVPFEAGLIENRPGSDTKLQDNQVLYTPAERNLEWETLEADLAGFVPADEIRRLRSMDDRAWLDGERVLYVPTYFAWGVV